MKKPRKTEEQKDLEKDIFLVPCPRCGLKQYYFLCDVDLFFICPGCGKYAWLRYTFLDRHRVIVNGLQLVLIHK
jgi:hypothetical protein